METLDEFEGDQSTEGDFTLTPTGSFGGKTGVAQVDGKYHGTFNSDEDAIAYIKSWMDKNKYWPNVWSVSDHGNWSLYEFDWVSHD